MFRKIARKLVIPDSLELYCARHTFGTVAMAETRDPGLVKDVMGREMRKRILEWIDNYLVKSGHSRTAG